MAIGRPATPREADEVLIARRRCLGRALLNGVLATNMSRMKIGLFGAGAVIVLVVAACSAAPGVATPIEPIASATPVPSMSSAEGSPYTIPTPSPTLAPSTTHTATTTLAGTVAEVIDGDTIHVRLGSGVEKVRIIGIDTPETVDPNRPASCYGPEATAFAKKTLAGRAVTLELDPTQDRRDRYDRLLAHVHVGKALYAAEAIAGGFGIHYIYEGREHPRRRACRGRGRGEGGQPRHLGPMRGPGRSAADRGRRDPRPRREPQAGIPGRRRLSSLVRAVRARRRPRSRL